MKHEIDMYGCVYIYILYISIYIYIYIYIYIIDREIEGQMVRQTDRQTRDR